MVKRYFIKKICPIICFLCLTACVYFVGLHGSAKADGENVVTEYKGKIAITFDDGPSATMTPQLLDGLKERGVHATFFLLGQYANESPEIVKRMKEEGHLIGNHTYNHVQLTKVSHEEFIKEIQSTNELIESITGETPQFIRPPFGAWKKSMEKEIDMIPVMWDVDPLDWCKDDVSCIVKNVVTHVKENDIILMHDRYASSVTAAMQIIDELTKQGYEFVTVEELLME